MIVADPSLIGRTVKVPLLLSANADLYFKGAGTPIITRPGRGIATPSGTNGEITVLTSANDFADDLVTIKNSLAARARELSAEADRLQRFGSATLADRIKELREEAAGLSCPRRPAQGRGRARRQAAEPARRHQRRARQDHQALRHPHHGRGSAPAEIRGRCETRRLEDRHLHDPREQSQGDRPGDGIPRALQGAREGRSAVQLDVLRRRRQPRA